MIYHLSLLRMARIKKIGDSKCWLGCEGKGTLMHCWWECGYGQPLRKTVWRSLNS